MGKISRRCMFVFIGCTIVLVLLLIWCSHFISVNRNKIIQKVEIYNAHEMVELEDNFFIDASENLEGYSIRVDGGKLVCFKEFTEENGGKIDPDNYSDEYPIPKYSYQADLTIKNSGNTDGSLNVLKFALYNKSLQLPVDFELWELIDENFDGSTFLRIRENSEVSLKIPFTPMSLHTATAPHELEKLMLDGEFLLCISEFPVRKMIRVISDSDS